MNTIWLMGSSPSDQPDAAGPKQMVSCTPWNTNLVRSWPCGRRGGGAAVSGGCGPVRGACWGSDVVWGRLTGL